MKQIDTLKSILHPGDVITIDGHSTWYLPWTCIVNCGIQWYQRRLFGKGSHYKPTHVVLYFAPDKVFSTTTPRARWENIEPRYSHRFTVFRYSKREYSGEHVKIMHDTAEKLIGLDYDIGDLLDFMISGLLGYDHVRKIRWFEFSRRRMVCSTSVRAIQEKLRKTLEERGDYSFPRLFNKLRPEKWSEEEVGRFRRTDVEMTTPAHYSNSEWFEGEFKKVCSWRDFR